jgi:hypothetical protein
MKRAWPLWLAFAAMALFFLHPLIFGLGNRISDIRFGHQLKPGKDRASIETVARQLGGIILTPRNENVVYVRLMDVSGLTGVGGREYALTFDANSHLLGWRTEGWMSQL